MRRADPDLWGYLAYGRLFVEQGGPVSSDPFSYTCVGCTWVSFEYLAQVLLWQAYHFGGPIGLIGLKCLLGAVCVCALFLAVRTTTDDQFVWVPVLLLATSAVARYFLFRPQLFTFAFFAIYVAVLLGYLLKRATWLWTLPAVMLAWVNLHGGFLAGLGVLCLALALRVCQNANAFGIGRRLFTDTKRLSITLLASMAVTLVNPQGWRLWPYVLTEISHGTNRRYIDEWRPTLLAGDHWSTATITLLVLILVVIGWRAQRMRSLAGGLYAWQLVVSCIPLAVMAYLSVRHIPIAAIWIAPVVTLLASGLTEQRDYGSKLQRRWTFVAALATVPTILTFVAVSVDPWPRIYAAGNTLGANHPCQAVAFLRESHVTGNIYAPLWWGSYITWQLFPAVRVSMDGRNISLFPDDMVVENLRFYSANMAEADVNAPFSYDTDFLLVPSDRPVLKRVLRDFRWQRVFADSDSTLFVRRDRALSEMAPAAGTSRPSQSNRGCSSWLQ